MVRPPQRPPLGNCPGIQGFPMEVFGAVTYCHLNEVGKWQTTSAFVVAIRAAELTARWPLVVRRAPLTSVVTVTVFFLKPTAQTDRPARYSVAEYSLSFGWRHQHRVVSPRPLLLLLLNGERSYPTACSELSHVALATDRTSSCTSSCTCP